MFLMSLDCKKITDSNKNKNKNTLAPMLKLSMW